MNSLVFRLCLLVCVGLLTACQGKTADEEPESSSDVNSRGDVIIPPAAPDFGTTNIEFDNSFVATLSATESGGVSTSVGIYDLSVPETDADSASVTTILETNANISLQLNTDTSNGDLADYSILVNNDSVWVLNLVTKQARFLWHSAQKICALHHIETLHQDIEVAGDGSETEVYRVIDDERVIVQTVSEVGGSANCQTEDDSLKRYYELGLVVDEADKFDVITATPIDEGLALSQLIIGYRDTNSGRVIDYGYLGYSSNIQRLEFYDAQRQLEWFQDRTLETFTKLILPSGEQSPSTLLNLTEVDDFRYVLQLGIDMFLVDSASEIFALAQDSVNNESNADENNVVEVDDILTDRFLRTELSEVVLNHEVSYYLDERDFFNTGDALLFENAYKIYRFPLPSKSPITGLAPYRIESTGSLGGGVTELAFSEASAFSQFDLITCQSDDQDCIDAHDVSGSSWQFIVACDMNNGCVLPQQESGICRTPQNGLIDLPACDSSAYQHLADLDNDANNAEVIGFMRYGQEYVSTLDLFHVEDSLIIKAKMRDREVLLRYVYDEPLSAPKISREQVLFGKDSTVQDIRVHELGGELFVNYLTPRSLRSNECYKNYIRVACNLASTERGGPNECTKKDFEAKVKLCYNQYRTYEPVAVHCTADEIAQAQCDESSAQQVGASDEGAKWLRLDRANQLGESLMALLVGNNDEAVDANELGEGALYNPELYLPNAVTGEPETLLGSVNGRVESTVGGSVEESLINPSVDDPQIRLDARFDVVSREEQDLGVSRAVKFAVMNTLDNDSASEVAVVDAFLTRNFTRLDSTNKKTVEELEAEADAQAENQ